MFLSGNSNPYPVVSVNLRQACDVVCQVGHCHARLSPDYADAAEHKPAHRTLDEAEHVLHAAAHFRFLPVGGFLFLGQRMVAAPFLADYRVHAFVDEAVGGAHVSCVKVYVLALFVVGIDELRCSF